MLSALPLRRPAPAPGAGLAVLLGAARPAAPRRPLRPAATATRRGPDRPPAGRTAVPAVLLAPPPPRRSAAPRV